MLNHGPEGEFNELMKNKTLVDYVQRNPVVKDGRTDTHYYCAYHTRNAIPAQHTGQHMFDVEHAMLRALRDCGHLELHL